MVPAWHSAVTECFCTALVFSSQEICTSVVKESLPKVLD